MSERGRSRIRVRAVPKSSRRRIEKLGDGSFRVYITGAPERGKANKELIGALSDHFNVPKSSFRIIRGAGSREKLIEISGLD